MSRALDPATIVAAARTEAEMALGAVVPPLHVSDAYRWDDPETKPAVDYLRSASPNRDALVERLARLERGAGGVVTPSGQAAAMLALTLLPAGARVVAPHDCYGGTYRLLDALATQGKLRATFVDQRDDAAFDAAIADGVEMLWLESPSNPLLRIVDLADRARAASAKGALVIADNTLMSPLRQRPLELGCDLVLHSTTKILNGHADALGGALIARDLGLVDRLCWWANASGLVASPHDAALVLRGLRTLPLRLDRQEATASAIANWLAGRPEVAAVNYPRVNGATALEGQQSGGGFLLSFELADGLPAAKALVGELRLITLASSLGGFATLICTPATMTHRGMSPEAQSEAGIAPGLLRLSVGLESPDDLIADLERGLAAVRKA